MRNLGIEVLFPWSDVIAIAIAIADVDGGDRIAVSRRGGCRTR
jgi:hypothetical protein